MEEKRTCRGFQSNKESLYGSKRLFDGLKESQLEERFFTIIFKKILPFYRFRSRPGRILLITLSSRLRNLSTTPKDPQIRRFKVFVNGALAIDEVKRWDVELDRFGKDRHDKRRNPSFQMWLYLNETGVNWGVLSNGRKWRLYCRTNRLMSITRLTWHP